VAANARLPQQIWSALSLSCFLVKTFASFYNLFDPSYFSRYVTFFDSLLFLPHITQPAQNLDFASNLEVISWQLLCQHLPKLRFTTRNSPCPLKVMADIKA
jgi:hypothetical protein